MIATPQLWLPDRLRERREDERLMRGRGGLSRRWMPQNPCGCSGCLLFEDDFDRVDIGDEWTVVSGDWSIDTGRLTSSDANAKICIEAGSQKIGSMEPAIVVNVVLQSIDGALARIYTNGTDYVECEWLVDGPLTRIRARINGGDSGLWLVTDETSPVKICHTGTHVVAMLGAKVLQIGLAGDAPDTVCLGFGTNAGGGDSGFVSVRVEHEARIQSGCPECRPLCFACTDGTTPKELAVTIPSVPNDSCVNCGDLADTYIVQPWFFNADTNVGPLQCQWRYTLPAAVCDIKTVVVNIERVGTNNELTVWLLVPAQDFVEALWKTVISTSGAIDCGMDETAPISTWNPFYWRRCEWSSAGDVRVQGL